MARRAIADESRQSANCRFADFARAAGKSQVAIRAGGIHDAIGLKLWVPAVCSAIDANKFQDDCHPKSCTRLPDRQVVVRATEPKVKVPLGESAAVLESVRNQAWGSPGHGFSLTFLSRILSTIRSLGLAPFLIDGSILAPGCTKPGSSHKTAGLHRA